MKRGVLISYLCLITILVGCGKVEPNPYALTKEARKEMKPKEQQMYIETEQALEALIASLNEPELTYEEGMKLIEAYSKKCPEDWQTLKEPECFSWQFFNQIKEGFEGTDTFEVYADCKDAVDLTGEKVAEVFEQKIERRKALIISEARFSDFYESGKEAKSPQKP